MMSSTSTNPTNQPNPSEFLPRAPGEGHAPRAPANHQRQGRGRGPPHGPVLPPNLPLPHAGHLVNRTNGGAHHAGPTPLTTGILCPTSQHIVENVTFKGRGLWDTCATGADMQLLRER